MCFAAVAGIATFVIGAAQAIAQFDAQAEDYKTNARNSMLSGQQEYRALTTRQIQEEESANQRKQSALLEGATKEAEVQVAGDAAGAAGLSLDHVLGEVDRRTNTNLLNLDKNYGMVAMQLQQEKDAVQQKAQGRIDSVQRPSTMGLVAGIGSSALDGFTAYQKMASS
jgi:hypothetical protein